MQRGRTKRQKYEWAAWQEWRLYRAFRLGLSYEAIANRLGFTDRDAVNGKIRRMRAQDPVRWAPRPCDGRWREKRKGLLTEGVGSGRRPIPSTPRITQMIADNADIDVAAHWWLQEDSVIGWIVTVPASAQPLLDLKPGQCKWPHGDVGDADFHFCCAPTGGRTYCSAHNSEATGWRREPLRAEVSP